jgi:hypothetical protein
MGMIQLASAPMLDPDLNDQRPRVVSRVVGERDIINNELGIFCNGYEAQTGKPVLTGEPTREYQEMFDARSRDTSESPPRCGPKRAAPTPWRRANSFVTPAMMFTAAIFRACSAPTRGTNPRSGRTGPRAARTAIYRTNGAG